LLPTARNDLFGIAPEEDLADKFGLDGLGVGEVPGGFEGVGQGEVLLCDGPARYSLGLCQWRDA
jgi:hypothetical protein